MKRIHFFWAKFDFCRISLISGFLFCQPALIAQLCTTMEAKKREFHVSRIDTTPSAGLSETHFFWDVGQDIEVRFLNGTPEQQSKVLSIAKEWEKFAYVKFVQVFSGPGNLRIQFGKEAENYSLIGTDANMADPTQPTMKIELSLFNEPSHLSRMVLHQFGHAIGFMHEHNLPESGILWNKDTVYKHYVKLGWDQEMVDAQLFEVYNHRYNNGLKYDKKSIMCFPIPEWQTSDGYNFKWNTQISEGDKLLAGLIYPFTESRTKEEPKVEILNYTKTLIKADKKEGGINFSPSFIIQTSGALSEVTFTITIYDKDGYPIRAMDEMYNVAGIVGTYKRMRMAAGQKLSVNKTNPEEFSLFIPYRYIPKSYLSSGILVLFQTYISDRGREKSVFSGNPIPCQMGDL